MGLLEYFPSLTFHSTLKLLFYQISPVWKQLWAWKYNFSKFKQIWLCSYVQDLVDLRASPQEANTSTLGMKNRRSCKQHPNDLPNDPFKKVFWWHSQLATNACGPQCDSCPFLSGKISGTWKIKLAVLVSGAAPKALPRWVANGEVGFLLSSVTHTRQCVLKVTGLWLTFYLITFPRYHFQCYLSNWNSTNPHNDQLLSRGQWVERGVAPYSLFSHICTWLYYSGKLVSLRRADLVVWDFPNQMCRWMCSLTTGKHIWKALKPTWTWVGFTCALWAQGLWERLLLNCGAFLEAWGQAGISTPRHWDNGHPGKWAQQFLPLFPTLLVPEKYSVSWDSRRGRQSSSDKRKSKEVKTNSRVAGGRWWSGKRRKSDNPALCCQMLNQVSVTPF